jgi:four helix bundle protein
MVNKVKYKSVEEIPVWLKSHTLVLCGYKKTSNFPVSERYGLTSQFRRCLISIPANISEGFYRRSIKELIQYLFIARGSLGESKYYARLSKDLGYLNEKEYNELMEMLDETGKQLNGWINSLKNINNQ